MRFHIIVHDLAPHLLDASAQATPGRFCACIPKKVATQPLGAMDKRKLAHKVFSTVKQVYP